MGTVSLKEGSEGHICLHPVKDSSYKCQSIAMPICNFLGVKGNVHPIICHKCIEGSSDIAPLFL